MKFNDETIPSYSYCYSISISISSRSVGVVNGYSIITTSSSSSSRSSRTSREEIVPFQSEIRFQYRISSRADSISFANKVNAVSVKSIALPDDDGNDDDDDDDNDDTIALVK